MLAATGDIDPNQDTVTPEPDPLRELAALRPGPHPVVRVVPGPRYTHLYVVTDDMPHLIDTQIAELRRRGIGIHRVVHPRETAHRDARGRLCAAGNAVRSVAESWTDIAVDPMDDATADGLATSVAGVLEELALHLGREAELVARLRTAAVEVAAAGGTDGSADLLLWCAAGNMHLVDVRTVVAETDGGADRTGTTPGVTVCWLPRISTVIRAERLVQIRVTDGAGRDHVVVGLMSRAGRQTAPEGVPVLGRRLRELGRRVDLGSEHWFGHRARQIVRTLPVPVLLRLDETTLVQVLGTVPEMVDQRQVRVVVDPGHEVASVVVFLPADRCTSEHRSAVRRLLEERTGGRAVEHAVSTTESGTATLHLTVDIGPDPLGDGPDAAALENDLASLLGTWIERLAALTGPAARRAVFPAAYRAQVEPSEAVADLRPVLDPPADRRISVSLRGEVTGTTRLLFRVHTPDDPLALSALLPLLQSLGMQVLDERSWPVTLDGERVVHVHHVGVRPAVPVGTDDSPIATLAARLEDAFRSAWHGDCDIDDLNQLVVAAGLTWEQCLLVRALVRYLQQTGAPSTAGYVAGLLRAEPAATAALVALFEARFDPATDGAGREAALDRADRRLRALLEDVRSRETDRLLRRLRELVGAVVRTNHFAARPAGSPPVLALKIHPRRLRDMPTPCPAIETFVYSRSVEGVHLRFDRIARGGLRWSDRAEDYRTEVLGLARAQSVKNALVVPAGAKGGFVSRVTPAHPADHYRTFVSALLDVVDDRAADGSTRTPAGVVRHDGDDDYLVVAADKGTARFSDVANEVALQRGFWLGDAFASGGRTGYDHKVMGITARGAWESVRRHLYELGLDADRDHIAVVGIGDMSGDVFGNGMLLSPHLRLLAAFDHRNVFLDPDPDPAVAFAERTRMFALPSSSWDDYDRAAISAGGGVFSRAAKVVPVGPEVRAALGLDDTVTALDPPALIRAILCAPVDLLWNGGVGTYVKASWESPAAVGDRTTTDERVDADRLRARAVVEGGNLGLTPAARSEFAAAGGLINTDAIDNSAGVGCSDHEVNTKILLDAEVRAGRLSPGERDTVLRELTDEIAELVLRQNRRHNTVLGVARSLAADRLGTHATLIEDLVERHGLDREVDALPGPEEIAERSRADSGLTAPEMATLLGRTKLALAAELTDSSLPDDPELAALLPGYFPASLTARFPGAVAGHPLARDITVAVMANLVVDRAGLSFCLRAAHDAGTTWSGAVRAFLVADAVFDLGALHERITGMTGSLPHQVHDDLVRAARTLVDRGGRRLLGHRPRPLSPSAEIERLRPAVQQVLPRLREYLTGTEAARHDADVARWEAAGVPADIARECATARLAVPVLDAVDLALELGRAPERMVALYVGVADRVGLPELAAEVARLPRTGPAETRARTFLRDRLHAVARGLTRDAATHDTGADTGAAVIAWAHDRAQVLAEMERTRAGLAADRRAPELARAVALVQAVAALPH